MSFPNDFVEKTDQAAGDSIEVHRARLQHLTARECQQFPGEGRGPLGLLTNAREASRYLRIIAILFEPQFRPSQNSAHNIVEIMRNATRQLADGLELLRLVELALHRPQFGHVLGHHLEFANAWKAPHVQAHRNQPAVPSPPFRFHSMHAAFVTARAG